MENKINYNIDDSKILANEYYFKFAKGFDILVTIILSLLCVFNIIILTYSFLELNMISTTLLTTAILILDIAFLISSFKVNFKVKYASKLTSLYCIIKTILTILVLVLPTFFLNVEVISNVNFIINTIANILVILLTVLSTKQNKLKSKNAFVAIFSSCFGVVLLSYIIIISVCGITGQNMIFDKNLTLSFELKSDNTYEVTSTVYGTGNTADIPLEFNGTPVTSINSKLLLNDKIEVIKLNAYVTITDINELRYTTKTTAPVIFTQREHLNSYLRTIYTNSSSYSTEFQHSLYQNFSVLDLQEDELVYHFNSFNLYNELSGDLFIPSLIKSKYYEFDLNDFNITYNNNKNDKNSQSDLEYNYYNQNKKMLVYELLEENNNKIVSLDVEEIFVYSIDDTNDTIFNNSYEWNNFKDSNTNYYFTSTQATSVYNNLLTRSGFTTKWYSNGSLISNVSSFMNYVRTNKVINPIMSINQLNNVTLVKNKNNFVYGDTLELSVNRSSTNLNVNYYLYIDDSFHSMISNDETFIQNGIIPGIKNYKIVVEIKDSSTSLTTEDIILDENIEFSKKVIDLIWNTPNGNTYTGLAQNIFVDFNQSLLVGGDSITVSPTISSIKDVSEITSNVSFNTTSGNLDYYEFTNTTANIKINKATLNITANNNTITYGDVATNLGVTYTGFVNNENASSLGGSLLITTSYNQYDAVQTYINAFEVSGYTSNNYNIIYNYGTLVVNKKDANITIENASKIYGESNPEFIYTSTGFVNNDKVNGSIITPSAVNVGSYDLTGNFSNNNYNITVENGNFEITKANLTITAKDKEITYGSQPANNGVTYSGFVNNDNVSSLGGSLLITTNYKQYDAVQTYLNSFEVSGYTSNNYNIIYKSGTLVVNKKDATLTIENASKIYGESNPEFSYTLTGFVNNDKVNGSIITPNAVNVGSYDLTGNFSNSNYNITVENGNFEITKANLNITANSNEITYGQAPEDDGYVATGFVNNENLNSLGVNIEYSFDYQQFDSVGDYKISVKPITLTNYNITYNQGDLTVNKVSIKITINDCEKFFNESDPTFSVQNTTLINGDTLDDLNIEFNRVSGEEAGTYKITAKYDNNNYDINFSSGTLTIKTNEIILFNNKQNNLMEVNL